MNAPDRLLTQSFSIQLSLETLVLACVLKESQRVGAQPLIRGLSPESFADLLRTCELGQTLDNGVELVPVADEFDELVELLLDHAEPPDQMAQWLAAAIATASHRDNHLWQDMGLPSRTELSAVLNLRFPSLAASNTGDMKWKKFFYRQLCQRAGVPICKSPSCSECCDYNVCFGPER